MKNKKYFKWYPKPLNSRYESENGKIQTNDSVFIKFYWQYFDKPTT